MAATLTTSRVFAALLALYDRLSAQEWSLHPTIGEPPHVALCDEQPGYHAETVSIIAEVDDDAIDWIRFPNGRDEAFTLNVVVRTARHADAVEVIRRLESLADVVQRAMFDEQATPATYDSLDLDAVQPDRGGVASVNPSPPYESNDAWAGEAVIAIRVITRI